VPTATVHLDTLTHNVACIRARLQPSTQVLAAVKANAYGHGAVRTARHLQSLGVSWFGVATREEALELREAGLDANILVFTPVYEGLGELVAQDVALTVVDERSSEAVSSAARGATARVHLKMDTGMGRLGGGLQETLLTAQTLDRARGVRLEGLWTHFACSDEEDRSFTERQLARFQEGLDAFRRAGLEVPSVHTANSAAVFAFPDAHFDLVRPGIAVYGYSSSNHVARLAPELLPALALTAPVIFVKRVRAGATVSYSASWTAPRDTAVATVRVGYADGYPRALGNRAHVRLHGQLCPVVGRVCMDQLMVDVGCSDVRPGDRATLFGPEGPTAEDLGRACGTISYELLTRLGARVERCYA